MWNHSQRWLIGALALMISGACWGQSEKNVTASFANGYTWQASSDDSKLLLVKGLRDAFATAYAEWPHDDRSPDDPRVMFLAAENLTLRETVASLEHIYSDEKNRVIPIAFAFQLVGIKLRWGSWADERVIHALTIWREMSLKLTSQPPSSSQSK